MNTGPIRSISPPPSEQEAAALTAAISRFLADNAPAAPTAQQQASAWQTAALREGVNRQPSRAASWAVGA